MASRYGRTIMTGVCFSRGRVIKPTEMPVACGMMASQIHDIYSAMLYPYLNTFAGEANVEYWLKQFTDGCNQWASRNNGLDSNGEMNMHVQLFTNVLLEPGIQPLDGYIVSTEKP